MNKPQVINEVLGVNPVSKITELQADELMISEIPDELKHKIKVKYFELANKYPGWKRHRLLRYACDYYHVKVTFTQ